MLSNSPKPQFRLPTNQQRTTVLGRTGSGKTTGAFFVLSRAPFDKMPYLILDFKREEIFRECPLIEDIGGPGSWRVPRDPGLYICQPYPGDEDDIDDLLWQILEQEYCGLFVDEGYMIGKSKALEGIYTQGRSKRIPVILCSQRPRFLTNFAFSEADFFMLFRLTTEPDQKRVKEFAPVNIEKPLPRHYSRWYDVDQESTTVLQPVPPAHNLIYDVNRRLEAIHRDRVRKQAL